MFTFGIVDDEYEYLHIISDCIVDCIGNNHDIYRFKSGKDLIKSNLTFDLVFLDIELETEDGIEVAKKLDYITSGIIFITSHQEKVFDAFNKNVYKFVLKNNLKKFFNQDFLEILYKMNYDTVEIYHNKEIDKVLKLTHLSNDRDKKCKELSGGMIRRLGIAQALMGEPDILVFDEPTAGLDPQERLKFREIINQLDFDIPIIISTHIVDDIYKQCSYILFLKDGKLIYSGLVNDLLQLLDNKVYSCHSSNIDNIKEEIYVVFNQNNIFRIVSKTVLKYDFLTKEEPTLDDAYVYLNS